MLRRPLLEEMMRVLPVCLASLLLAGCGATTTRQMLEGETGGSIARATLVAGPADGVAELPNGLRAFTWVLPPLVPTSPGRCVYVLTAEHRLGEVRSLAAWRIVDVEEQAGPGCGSAAERLGV